MNIRLITFRVKLARVLKTYRRRSGLTAAYVAGVVGLDRTELEGLEDAQIANPGAGQVLALMHYFGIPVTDLVDPDAPSRQKA